MADRLSQYPMMPNFNPGLMQQQQHQQHQLNQQAQQQQQDLHPSLPGFPDQGRMWQQIQHLQQFHQGGGDMNNSQNNPQMMDLLRSQSLARVQGQQQQQQQLNNQQFGLGGQQLGNNIVNGGPGNTQQQQPFLESGANPQQSHISGFSNSTGLTNASSLQPPMSRNPMLQTFQNQAAHGNSNPSFQRQLELMLAQNQQPQNGQMGLAARMEQQQRQQQQAQHQQHIMNQSSSGDFFSPGMSDRRPSPAHPNMQTANPMGSGQPPLPQQQPQQQQRRITIAEFSERANNLRTHIIQLEATMTQFNSQRGTSPDAVFINKMRALATELKAKKEYLSKMNAAMQSMGANMSAIAQVAAQHQQNGGVGHSWMPQANASQSFDKNGNTQMVRPQVTHNQQQGSSNVQPSPSHLHAQVQPTNHLIAQGVVSPPRSGPTPHQQQLPASGATGVSNVGGQFSNQMSPNLGPQFPFPVNNAGGGASSPSSVAAIGVQPTPSGGMQLPPPLDKTRFEHAYNGYTARKGIKHDAPQLMSIEGRDIDLCMLHTQVMQEGGWHKVHNNELWSVIGGRMGFIHLPATDTEPAKSAPGVAQHLAQVYKDYLSEFDRVYIDSVIDSRRKLQAAAAAQAQAAALAANGNGGPSQPQQPRGPPNAQQMQAVIGYANLSVTELRAQGVSEKMIMFVENNRAHLQRTVMEQGMFRGQLQNQGLRPPEQHGISNTVGPFSGVPTQTNTPSVPQHQQFLQQQPNGMLQGNDNRQQHLQQHPHLQNGPGPLSRPTADQVQRATAFVEKTKKEFAQNNLPNMRGADVPMEQRTEFNSLLEKLHHFVDQIDNKLPTYCFVLKSDDLIKKLIAIIMTVRQQRSYLASNSPRFIVSLEILRNMMNQVHNANDSFNAYLKNAMNRSHHLPQPQPQPHALLNHPTPDITRASFPQQQPLPPQALSLPNRPPVALRPPAVMKKPSASTPAAVSTPTPPPAQSASTPVASAPTPTQTTSPQAPKSPKGKAPAKPKPPPKRRVSVKNPPTSQPLATEHSQAQTASGNNGHIKRAREEESVNSNTFEASPAASSSAIANEPSPPKRIKTEWEGPPSEELKKKTETIESIKTEEDASNFLEQMTELIKMAAEGEGQESLTSDISETLDQILKGYGTVPEGSEDIHGLSSLSGLGESSNRTPPPTKPPADEFVEFFDFSSFVALDDDEGSKAPTPDLLSSSSTNLSPESGSEADAAHHALLEPKSEDFSDLRLGVYKEIDGGESAYYQSGNWSWDSPMPTQEQPWAIFTS